MGAREFTDIDVKGNKGDVLGRNDDKSSLGVEVRSSQTSWPLTLDRGKKKTLVYNFPKSHSSDQLNLSMTP